MVLYVAKHGITVHEPNPDADPMFHMRAVGESDASQFGGRIPILWDSSKRHLYVGNPNWTHPDTQNHFEAVTGQPHKPHTYDEGYVAGGEHWANGDLKWFMHPPEEHPEIADALEEIGIPVPNKEHEPISEENMPLWMRPDTVWGEPDHEDHDPVHWHDEND